MQKRGELTSAQISTLILTIIGFIIALIFLLVVLDTQNLSEREICKLSVLTRATAPEALERITPLSCTTQKICLTEGEDCQQFMGEKGVRKVLVNSNKETIEKETANAMYDCWTMMGEGKLDVFGGGRGTGIWSLLDAENLFQAETVCVICSRLAIANDVNSSLLEKVDINSYMENHQVPHSELTYLQTFTDQQVRSYPRTFRDDLTNNQNNFKEEQKTSEIAMIFMQITADKGVLEAAWETGTKTGGFLFTSSVAVTPLGLARGGVIGALSGAISAGVAAYQTWESHNIAAGYCGEFTSVDNARKGCSVVTPFNYQDAAAINQYCDHIEGQP